MMFYANIFFIHTAPSSQDRILDATPGDDSSTPEDDNSTPRLSAGTRAGIAVAVLAAILLFILATILAILVVIHYRKWTKDSPETSRNEAYGLHAKHETVTYSMMQRDDIIYDMPLSPPDYEYS